MRRNVLLPPSPSGGGGSARLTTGPPVVNVAPEGPGATVPDGWGHPIQETDYDLCKA